MRMWVLLIASLPVSSNPDVKNLDGFDCPLLSLSRDAYICVPDCEPLRTGVGWAVMELEQIALGSPREAGLGRTR